MVFCLEALYKIQIIWALNRSLFTFELYMKLNLRCCSIGLPGLGALVSVVSTVTVNGDFGTSLLANSTLTVYCPGSFGVKFASYPSGDWLVGSSKV